MTLALIGVVLALAAPQTVGALQGSSQVSVGRKVYERETCVTCHQIAQRGNSRFPLDGVASRLSAADLRRWLTDPAAMEAALPKMPAVRMSAMKYRLNTRDLDALVAYLRTLK